MKDVISNSWVNIEREQGEQNGGRYPQSALASSSTNWNPSFKMLEVLLWSSDKNGEAN